MKTPEELSLELMAEWFKNVSKDEFMAEYNSLGDNYTGITIGEFLGIGEDDEIC